MSCLWDEDDKWYPIRIADLEAVLENYINNGLGISRYAKIRKNIAYNLQMLEYLHETLASLELSGVLITQTFKMHIIIAGGIIESLLFCALKSQGYQSTSQEKAIKKTSTSLNVGVKTFRLESTVFEPVAPFDIDMSFDAIIKKAEGKRVLGTNQTLYNNLHKVRKLRNKVHLHAMEDSTSVLDTDWYSFNKNEYNLTRKTLWEVLLSLIGNSIANDTRFAFLHS